MSAKMSILGRAIAYLALAAALLAAAITLNLGKYPAGDGSNPKLSTATSDLDPELAQCKAIGLEAADAKCKGVWEANRNRFFRSGKPYQNRVADAVPAAPSPKEAATAARADANKPPRSPTTQDSLDRPGDTTGRLK
jgi:conjugative transfer region protein TrbK